jgi:hypothetical protein
MQFAWGVTQFPELVMQLARAVMQLPELVPQLVRAKPLLSGSV